MQALSAKPLCYRAVGPHWMAQMGLVKEEEFLHVRSQVTAALWCLQTRPFLSSNWWFLVLYF